MPAVYDELVDLLARGSTSEQVATFAPSTATRERVYELLGREKSGVITADEKRELDVYTQLETILGLAKAKAKLLLKKSAEASHK